jgi:hypothetical protein
MNSIMETIFAICMLILGSTKSGISFQKLIYKIRREFRVAGLDIKVTTVRDKTLGDEIFYANGYYDPADDEDGERCIELVVTHNFSKDEIWYQDQVRQLLIQVFDTVVHELKHQRQYRKRHFKMGLNRGTGYKDYLADPEEVDAYSISIAIELCRSLGKTRALRYLHNVDKLSRFKIKGNFVSPCLASYLAEFSDSNHPIIRDLSKKVYVRLKKIDTDYIFQ